jgi:hypothetical protein
VNGTWRKRKWALGAVWKEEIVLGSLYQASSSPTSLCSNAGAQKDAKLDRGRRRGWDLKRFGVDAELLGNQFVKSLARKHQDLFAKGARLIGEELNPRALSIRGL